MSRKIAPATRPIFVATFSRWLRSAAWATATLLASLLPGNDPAVGKEWATATQRVSDNQWAAENELRTQVSILLPPQTFRLERLPPAPPPAPPSGPSSGPHFRQAQAARPFRGPFKPVAQVDERDWVFFAADSFEAPVPPTWQVHEAAFGRDVRMLLTPSLDGKGRLPDDGLWVSYSVDPVQQNRPLETILRERVMVHTNETAAIAKPQRTSLGGHPAVFSELSEYRGQVKFEGGHLLIAAPWCLFEVHWTYPVAVGAERRPLVQKWLSEINFTPPEKPRGQLPPHVAPASAVVGAWKAYRSRLKFEADGRVVVLIDPPRITRVDASAKKPEQLVGTYHGQGDLLYVVWDDGSKLNFRWRVEGDRLLLTDHEGQVSQLRKLLE